MEDDIPTQREKYWRAINLTMSGKYKEALKLAREIEDKHCKRTTLKFIVSELAKAGKYEEALKCFDLSLENMNLVEDMDSEELNELQNIISYIKRYIGINDRGKVEEIQKKIAKILKDMERERKIMELKRKLKRKIEEWKEEGYDVRELEREN